MPRTRYDLVLSLALVGCAQEVDGFADNSPSESPETGGAGGEAGASPGTAGGMGGTTSAASDGGETDAQDSIDAPEKGGAGGNDAGSAAAGGTGGATGGGGPSTNCGAVTYAGKCKSEVLTWCENGTLHKVNCKDKGKVCGYQDANVGYNCLVELGGCGALDALGKCSGSVLSWCENGVKKVVDCADTGRTCEWENSSIGYNCVSSAPPSSGGSLGFGYPVGDKSTYPAGGWQVSQVLGNYLYQPPFVGGHLAEDIFEPNGNSANAPVYSVADGVVVYAGSNTSSYKNVVLIKHDLGNGKKVCSFYGHLWPPAVKTGQAVKRGQKIAEVMDWVYFYGWENSHLHYVIVSENVCNQALAGSGGLCGYDSSSGPTGYTNLSNEPASYTSAGDPCGSQIYKNGYLSPAQFVQAHHY